MADAMLIEFSAPRRHVKLHAFGMERLSTNVASARPAQSTSFPDGLALIAAPKRARNSPTQGNSPITDAARPAGRYHPCRPCGSAPIFNAIQRPRVRTAMRIRFWITMLAMALLLTGARAKADYEVVTRNDIVFAEHAGVKLLGDFYAPKSLDKAPVLVAVHGGGWQVVTRKFYSHWGPYLAKHGYAPFAIDYRLMKRDVKTYPGAVYDTKAAVQ